MSSGAAALPRGGQRISLLPLYAVNLIGSLGFSIVLPFLVFLVEGWGGNAFVYGLVGATYSSFQLVGAPVLGRWSDRVGRRRVLLWSQLGTLASWCLFLVAFLLPEAPVIEFARGVLGGAAITLPLLAVFLARAVDGLTGGNISVANAYLADVSSDADRNANYGRMAVAANLGFVLGPVLGGLLGATRWGYVAPVAAALVISLAASIIIAFLLPESRPREVPHRTRGRTVGKALGQEPRECVEESSPELSLAAAMRLPGVGTLLVIYFLVMLGFNIFYVGFPVHAAGPLGWSVRDTGIFFAVLSGLMVLVQGPLLAYLSRRVSEGVLARVGAAILAVCFLAFTREGTPFVYAGAALLALGNGLMWPSVVSILARTAGDRYQGAVQGIAGSAGAVASILGLLLGGMAYGVLGSGVFLISAGVIGLVFVLALVACRGEAAAITQAPEAGRG